MNGPPDQIPPSASIEAGVARRDITPPVGIYNRSWGAAKHDVAEGVHRPLSLTVLAMRKTAQDAPLVLASIDGGWWQDDDDQKRLRGTLLERLGLDPARVMLSLTHTHASCSLCREDADKPGGRLIMPYLVHLTGSLVEATKEALAGAKPAILTWAAGRSGLATNRDLPDPEKDRIVCGFNPRNPADDTVLVGRVTEPSGRAVATLVNYACHPTTLAWDNRLLSPDYVGAMREVVERETGGAPCLFLQGASGELAPREQYTGDTAIADANGRQLGLAVVTALSTMLPPATALEYAGVVESGAPLATWRRRAFEPSAVLDVRQITVDLPLKKLPSREEVERELAACTDRAMTERLRRKLRIVRSMGSGPTCAIPVWLWRIGDGIIVGTPNEAYSDFQIALRAAFPDLAIVVMNIVNGQSSYLSPPERYDHDIYQVWQSPFDRDALPRLIEACKRHIANMLDESR